MIWRKRERTAGGQLIPLEDIVARMEAVVRDIRALRRLLDALDGQMAHTDSRQQHDKEPGD